MYDVAAYYVFSGREAYLVSAVNFNLFKLSDLVILCFAKLNLVLGWRWTLLSLSDADNDELKSAWRHGRLLLVLYLSSFHDFTHFVNHSLNFSYTCP